MMNGGKSLQMLEFEKNQKQCPNGCIGSQIAGAVPPKGSLANAWQRCIRCDAYWEITPSGKVTARRIPMYIDIGDKPFEDAKAEIARQIEELKKQTK